MDVVKKELVDHTAERGKSEKIPTWILIATSTELGTHRSVHTKFTGTAPSMGPCSRTKRNSKHGSEALKLIGLYNNVGKHHYAFSVPQQPCCKQYFPENPTDVGIHVKSTGSASPSRPWHQSRCKSPFVASKAHQPSMFSFYSTTVQQATMQEILRFSQHGFNTAVLDVKMIGKDGRSNCNVRTRARQQLREARSGLSPPNNAAS
jgi:hypothetical protein